MTPGARGAKPGLSWRSQACVGGSWAFGLADLQPGDEGQAVQAQGTGRGGRGVTELSSGRCPGERLPWVRMGVASVLGDLTMGRVGVLSQGQVRAGL